MYDSIILHVVWKGIKVLVASQEFWDPIKLLIEALRHFRM